MRGTVTTLFAERATKYASLGILLLLAAFAVLPALWMFITAFKTVAETYTYPPTWLPRQPTLDSFAYILRRGSFPTYFRNSTVVALAATVLTLAIAIPAGYAFSRFHFPGSGFLPMTFLITQMFPSVLLIIPLFQLVRALHLLNTLYALVLADVTFALPLTVWLLKVAFDQIPRDLDEAALIDGCGWASAFTRVILPVSLPGIAAAGIFAFIAAWDEFVFALTFTTSDALRTLPVGLQYFITAYEVHWNHLAAGSLVATLPVLVLFFFMLRFLIGGILSGATRG